MTDAQRIIHILSPLAQTMRLNAKNLQRLLNELAESYLLCPILRPLTNFPLRVRESVRPCVWVIDPIRNK